MVGILISFVNFQKEFPLPQTLFDDYKDRGLAAKSAEMNLLLVKIWS